jgi:hypothetical protein
MMVMDTTTLNETVEVVRKAFFPQWDRECLCQLNPRLNRDCGRCINKRNLIWISPLQSNPMAVLIHEICHAVCPNFSHGSGWQNRMLKAADRAIQQIGTPELAEALKQELSSIVASKRIRRSSEYIST